MRDFLAGLETPLGYLQRVAASADRYDGFNLIVGDLHDLGYYSNRTGGSRTLAPGVYGLSNHLLDTPWPKVERGKEALSGILSDAATVSTDDIFTILADCSVAPEQALPETGVGREAERKLSPIFIRGFPFETGSIYGTRASTALLIDKDENVTFVERTFGAGSEMCGEVAYRFPIEAQPEVRTHF